MRNDPACLCLILRVFVLEYYFACLANAHKPVHYWISIAIDEICYPGWRASLSWLTFVEEEEKGSRMAHISGGSARPRHVGLSSFGFMVSSRFFVKERHC
jgi:hypothetical protein